MNIIKRFKNHYQDGYMPWAHKNPDFNLVEMVERWPIKPCKILEMGCGTGTDAIWLASQNFDVTACDVTDIAIQIAESNLLDKNTKCNFHVLDCLNDAIPESPFEFVFDRGYFHSYDTKKDRRKLAKKIAESLKPNGLWLSISGSFDAPERETGPPRLKAKDIIDGVEDHFKILSLNATQFGNDEEDPARAWVYLLRKR